MDTLFQDLRYAFRSLRKSPGFTITAVLSLALGIAACTVVVGVIYGVNFQRLPYRDAGRLVQLQESLNPRCAPVCADWANSETVRIWRERARSFEDIATTELRLVRMGGEDSVASVVGAGVSVEFFATLGVRPLLGRPLLPSDFEVGAEPAVVIGRRLWAGSFATSRDALGQRLRLDGRVYTIVGVLPSDFAFPGRADLWFAEPAGTATNARLGVVARLKPGVSLEQGSAELRAISDAREREEPTVNLGRVGSAVSMRAATQEQASDFWMLLGAVGATLLIACANVASLSLVRALARERELAVRAALGASEWRLMMPSVAEGILVALGGGLAGVVLAVWTGDLARALLHRVYSEQLPLALGPVVLGAGFALAFVIGIVVGIVPVFHLRRMELQQSLREGAATTTTGNRAGRLRRVLVVAEIAVALVLLTGAGLLTASFLRIHHYDLGYDADHVFVAPLGFPDERPSNPQLIQLTAASVVERVVLSTATQVAMWGESFPRSSARSVLAPFDQFMVLEGRQTTLTVAAVPPNAYHVSPAFFEAIGLTVIKGRQFTEADKASSEQVAIVNEEAARLWWPGEDPLGKRFTVGRPDARGPWLTVVGVVANSHTIGYGGTFGALVNPGYFPLLFRPLAQSPPARSYWIGLRAREPANLLASTLRREVESVDPRIRVGELATLRNLTTGDERLTPVELDAQLLSGLAVFGVFLALVGIYGLVADMVRRRTQEIGIRIALGAQGRDLVAVVMKDSLRLAMLGVAVGLLGSYWLTGMLRGLLFGMSPTNPRVFAIVCVALGVAVVLASYLPARRATRVDPMIALRAE
jgi:putative ABC transport system permease protein